MRPFRGGGKDRVMTETGTSCVLVIGIDPHAAIHLGIDVDAVVGALARGQARFDAAGVPSELCLVGLDPVRAFDQIAEKLSAREYACVVIGGGIRKPEPMLRILRNCDQPRSKTCAKRGHRVQHEPGEQPRRGAALARFRVRLRDIEDFLGTPVIATRQSDFGCVVGQPDITQFFERVGLAGICSSMRTARPAARSPHPFFELRADPFDMLPPCLLFLD